MAEGDSGWVCGYVSEEKPQSDSRRRKLGGGASEVLIELPAEEGEEGQREGIVEPAAVLVVPPCEHDGGARPELVAGHVCQRLALPVHLILARRVKLPRHVVQRCTAHAKRPQGECRYQGNRGGEDGKCDKAGQAG